jgi:tripartite-type tricarboxylate transporter receptor subunit TctC
MQQRGAEAVSNNIGEFTAYIRRDVEKWAPVIKAVGVTVE